MTDFLSTIQYYAAPILAPVPTAIAVGATLNHTLMTIPGTPVWLAMCGALSGAIAIEFGGGLMFSGAGVAFARRQWGALRAASVGALLYVGIVIYSVWTGGDSRPLVGSVLVTFVAYLAKAIMDYLREGKAEVASVQQNTLDTLSLNVELEKQRAAQERAKARVAKLSSGGQTGGRQATQFVADQDLITAIQDYWQAHPNATTREVAQACGCSPTTAGKYKP
jgi:cell division protein FtsB